MKSVSSPSPQLFWGIDEPNTLDNTKTIHSLVERYTSTYSYEKDVTRGSQPEAMRVSYGMIDKNTCTH